jgi:hypothetical protein
MKTTLCMLALAFALAAPAAAQSTAFRDSLLDRLAGRWVLSGEIEGKATTHDVTAEWVIAHEYLRLHEVSRERDAQGHPAYEGMVFVGVDEKTNEYVCLWLDSTGNSGLANPVIGRAPRGGEELPFVFAFPGGAGAFRTTFAYRRAGDTWQWRMDAEDHGTLQPFARVTLARAKRAAR